MLSKLHMHQTTASYKLFGVAKTMQDQLVKLKNVPFSLNLDEATSTNLLRVFSVLVLYYDKEKHSLVSEQLASLSGPVVDAENLFRELQSIFSAQLTTGKVIGDAHGLCLCDAGREDWTGEKSERSCSSFNRY